MIHPLGRGQLHSSRDEGIFLYFTCRMIFIYQREVFLLLRRERSAAFTHVLRAHFPPTEAVYFRNACRSSVALIFFHVLDDFHQALEGTPAFRTGAKRNRGER